MIGSLNKVTVVVVASSVSVFAIIALMLSLDTTLKRQWYNSIVDTLVHRSKMSPNDPQPIYDLLKIAKGSYSFGATKACVSLGHTGEAFRFAKSDIAQLMFSKDPFVSREATRAILNSKIELDKSLFDSLKRRFEQKPVTDANIYAIMAIGNGGSVACDYLQQLTAHYPTNIELLDEAIHDALIKLKSDCLLPE